MRSQPSSQTDLAAANRSHHLLFVLTITIGLTLLGLALIATACWNFVPPIAHTAQFDAQFTVLDGFFYAEQPAKTAAYQAGCLALPVLLALSFWLARRWTKILSEQAIHRINGAGIVLYLLLIISCACPIIYCPHPPFWITPPNWIILPFTYSHPVFAPSRLLCLALAVATGLYFLTSAASRKNANRALSILLLIWALLIPSRFYAPSEIDNAPRYVYPLNAVLDALSQSVNGHHLLVNFPHIYGGYVEMLAPVIRFFPRDIGVLIASLALPNVLGMLCLLLTARLIIRRPAILFLCGLTLISTGYLATSDDINYAYASVRLFMVQAGLLGAVLYFHQPNMIRYAAVTIIAALASIWNLDTGIVFWLAWTATCALTALASRNWTQGIRHVLIQIVTMALVWTAFIFYLRLDSGRWPDGGLLFYFQKLVLDSGYFCIRLLFPDMWVFILILYVAGLAIAFRSLVQDKAAWLTPVILLLALLGIGIFSYFMGRSVPSNLVAVAYPAVLLAGIFCAEGEILIKRRKLPPIAKYFLVPSKIALFWWSFTFVAALPDLLAISGDIVRNWNNPTQTSLRANAAFITQHVQPHEEGVFFLSNHSGIFYYLSDTVRPLKIPGMIELLRTQDMNVLVDAIRQRRINKLFVEQNFSDTRMYGPEIYQEIRDAIAQNYQPSETGPAGLVLYTPR